MADEERVEAPEVAVVYPGGYFADGAFDDGVFMDLHVESAPRVLVDPLVEAGIDPEQG